MRETILADTGPLVALLDEGDQWHKWAVAAFRELRPPLLTCEAVLAEACHLLDATSRKSLNRLHATGVLVVALSFNEECSAIWRLLAKYADVPMDFADGCLVRMAEARSSARVWTTDAHFSVYRRNGRQGIPLILAER